MRSILPGLRPLQSPSAIAVLVFGAQVWFSPMAAALPTLQLNMPNGQYFQEIEVDGQTITESWFTTDNPFALQVVGAPSPAGVDFIQDVEMWIAIQKDDFESNPGGSVTVTRSDPGEEGEVTPDPVAYGTPAVLAPHGVYDAYYIRYALPNLEVTGPDVVDIWNYNEDYDPDNPGPAEGTGDIQNYYVAYSSYSWLHIDVSGVAVDSNGHHTRYWTRVAPYSHDADAPGGGTPPPPGEVPEPATTLTFVSALGVFAYLRRRKFA